MPIVSFTKVYVVEFQKRGLSHAHIILTIAMQGKITCLEDVDRLISAEIPNQSKNPLAYDTVTIFMIHGLCVSCFIDEKCSNVTQKDFAIKQHLMSMTSLNIKGGVLPNKWSSMVEKLIINRWSRTIDLCVEYNAHMNVKHVAICSMVNYLYKYIHKGHDHTTIAIKGNTTHHW